MRRFLPKRSKKGVTLVESVIAVVLLGILAAGILSLMTASGTKISSLSGEAADLSAATQKLDLVISAISNGSESYIIKKQGTVNGEPATFCYLDTAALLAQLELDDVTLTASFSLYSGSETLPNNGESTAQPLSDIRGWYLTLTYKSASVSGFASNSEGVFDQQ